MREGGGKAVILFLALIVVGFLQMFNKLPLWNLSFNGGFMTKFWAFIARFIVSPLLIMVSLFVIYQIMKD